MKRVFLSDHQNKIDCTAFIMNEIVCAILAFLIFNIHLTFFILTINLGSYQ